MRDRMNKTSRDQAERERAQRILEQQLRQRDPGVSKIKGYDWDKHAQRTKQVNKSRQKPLLLDLFDILPRRWKGALIGLAVGLLPLAAGLVFLAGEWQILAPLGLVVCAITGYVVGAAAQDAITKR